MGRNQRDEVSKNNYVQMIEFVNHSETDATVSLSGALFLSGGALTFVGSSGSVTTVGAS